MKGRNEIILNQDSMCEVVQQWTDREFVRSGGIEVKNVKYNNTSGTFEIELFNEEEKEEETA